MSLTRSSIWTTKDGIFIRVRDMRIVELATALLYIEQLQLEELDADPYVVESFCSIAGCEPRAAEPKHTINGATLDDWYDFLTLEFKKRADQIEKRMYPPKKKPSLKRRLVNALKFW